MDAENKLPSRWSSHREPGALRWQSLYRAAPTIVTSPNEDGLHSNPDEDSSSDEDEIEGADDGSVSASFANLQMALNAIDRVCDWNSGGGNFSEQSIDIDKEHGEEATVSGKAERDDANDDFVGFDRATADVHGMLDNVWDDGNYSNMSLDVEVGDDEEVAAVDPTELRDQIASLQIAYMEINEMADENQEPLVGPHKAIYDGIDNLEETDSRLRSRDIEPAGTGSAAFERALTRIDDMFDSLWKNQGYSDVNVVHQVDRTEDDSDSSVDSDSSIDNNISVGGGDGVNNVSSVDSDDSDNSSDDESDDSSNNAVAAYERVFTRRQDAMPCHKEVQVLRANTSPFRLLDLTPELLLKVVEYLVILSYAIKPVELCNHTIWTTLTTKARQKPTRISGGRLRSQPAIARVNRTLRDIALPSYYSRNTFTTAETIVEAGSPYPWYRYPSDSSARYLHNLRTLRCFVLICDICPTAEHARPEMWWWMPVTLQTRPELGYIAVDFLKYAERELSQGCGEFWKNTTNEFLEKHTDGEVHGINLLKVAVMLQKGITCESPEAELRRTVFRVDMPRSRQIVL
jgi:hypothetical protein